MKTKLKAELKKRLIFMLIYIATVLPVSAFGIELTDYLEPNYKYQDAELGLQFNMSDGNQDQVSYNGIANLMYEMGYSTLPLTWDISIDADTDFNRGSHEGDGSTKNLLINGETTVNKYLGDYTGPFVYGGLVLGVQDLEGSKENDPYIKASAGLGYGRITTATPLMEAVRCIEDLSKYGLIVGDVTDDIYLKLADVIARESEYKSRYSKREYETYWYEDMETVLKEAGILRNEIFGALGIIRIQDILTYEQVLKRKHGWEARVHMDYFISDYSGEDGDPGMGISYEYAKPFGFKWQLINKIEYSTIIVNGEFGDAAHKISNAFEMNYEMGDKIDWENIWEFNIIWKSNSNSDDTYMNKVDTGLRFYLSNTIDAKTGLIFTHKDQGDNPDDKIDSRLYLEMIYTIF